MITKIRTKYSGLPIAVKATIWFMFCNILQKSITVLTMPIFTRIMSTKEYGQFSVYNSWMQIFTIITTLRLNYAVFNKGMSRYKDSRDDYLATMQTMTFANATILLLVYLLFYRQINSIVELPTIIMVFICVELMFTPAIDFWSIKNRYEYVYKRVVICTLLLSIINTLVGLIVVLLSSEKGYARIISVIFVNACFGIILFIYNKRKSKIWFKKEYAVFALGFNIPLLLHYFSQFVLDKFDNIMIQKMQDVSTAGLYSVAYGAGFMMKIVTQSINNAFIPWQYHKLEKNNIKEVDDVVFLVYIFVASCILLFIFFAPEALGLLASEKYQEAVYVIPPVALGLFFSFMYSTFANVEFFYDKNKFTMYISLAGAGLNIILNYFGIKAFGYIAAAYTTLICYILFALGHYIYMSITIKKALKINKVFNTIRLLIISGIFLTIGLLSIYLYRYTLIRYVIIILFLVILYYKRNILKNVVYKVKTTKNME